MHAQTLSSPPSPAPSRRALAPVGAFLSLALFTLGLPGVAAAGLEDAKMASLRIETDQAAYAPGSAARLTAHVRIEPGWHVNSHTPTFARLIPTLLKLELPDGWPEPHFEYPAHKMQSFAFQQEQDEPLAVYDGEFLITADLTIPAGVAQDQVEVKAVLSYQACNDNQCLRPTKEEVTTHLKISASPVVNPAPAGGSAPFPPQRGLLGVLLLAFIGGLILNAMPCVLPVLSLKLFGLVQDSGRGRRAITLGALATTAGILVSFLALAGVAIGAKAAGAAVGWGVQFQNPGFVTALLVVVILFCLNLWGLFEVPMPRALANVGGAGDGLGGHFGSGLFATLMATPCSAPFLGTALGFALAREAGVIAAVFLAIGLGMALPYLLLAGFPRAASWLPRPGAWMDTLRKALGFLLAGAGVWLLYVLNAQVSAERLAAVQGGLLVLALLIWWRHHQRTAGRAPRWVSGLLAAAAAVATVVVALPAQSSGPRREAATERLIPWVEFDRQRAESLAREGKLVFVDVTADWCFTCKVNERVVLETEPVASAFQRLGVVAMKADWTQQDPAIGDFLASHGRYGIPFYVLYQPGKPPHLFSEILRKSEVLDVINAAAPAAVASTH